MNKKKRPRIKMPESPIGIASWPKLAKPDYTHKKQEGSFEVNLILTPEQVGDYKATYDKNSKELYKWCCENEGKAKLKHSPYLRFLPDTDKDGNETGNTKVLFRMKHKVFNKDGDLAFEKRPVLFDKYGSVRPEEVGAGAKIRVMGTMIPYYTSIGFGITFEPTAVMVIEEGSTGSNIDDAAGLGFTVEEAQRVNGGESIPDSAFGKEVETEDTEELAHDSDF